MPIVESRSALVLQEHDLLGRLPVTTRRKSFPGASVASGHTSVTVRFGQRLRSLREQAKMTQGELAHHLGIDRSFISDVERARKTISLSYIETIAQGFNLPIDKLLADL